MSVPLSHRIYMVVPGNGDFHRLESPVTARAPETTETWRSLLLQLKNFVYLMIENVSFDYTNTSNSDVNSLLRILHSVI